MTSPPLPRNVVDIAGDIWVEAMSQHLACETAVSPVLSHRGGGGGGGCNTGIAWLHLGSSRRHRPTPTVPVGAPSDIAPPPFPCRRHVVDIALGACRRHRPTRFSMSSTSLATCEASFHVVDMAGDIWEPLGNIARLPFPCRRHVVDIAWTPPTVAGDVDDMSSTWFGSLPIRHCHVAKGV